MGFAVGVAVGLGVAVGAFVGASVGASVMMAVAVEVGSAVAVEVAAADVTMAVGAVVGVVVVDLLSPPLPIAPSITRAMIMGKRHPDFFFVLRFAKWITTFHKPLYKPLYDG